MINVTSTYQRTDAGREEIRRKTHGLTQSERLVLILIDGITDVAGVRAKLRGLTDDRYQRAMQKLIRNKLITEVLLPLVDQKADEVEDDIAELFLRQDALDPVTIISMDPEDEYDSSASIAPTCSDKGSTSDQSALKGSTIGGDSQWAHMRTAHAPEVLEEGPAIEETSRRASDSAPNDSGFRSEAQIGHANQSVHTHPEAGHHRPPQAATGRQAPSGNGFKWQYWVLLAVASAMVGLGILFY